MKLEMITLVVEISADEDKSNEDGYTNDESGSDGGNNGGDGGDNDDGNGDEVVHSNKNVSLDKVNAIDD